ncbi:conserved hypothetical protein [Culex quinquefasciatus]|uniref:Uncharacterized protein n=1 Tax=Culex quinquefasciatus TaxID=7176 RepID=B0WWC0_CULQU|nr:conserved hypothetical protein [Culex quinquefasciatus]|eukprot:XP_001861692.1 conserved hypothetical protein [Culex quinquefasciatus]
MPQPPWLAFDAPFIYGSAAPLFAIKIPDSVTKSIPRSIFYVQVQNQQNKRTYVPCEDVEGQKRVFLVIALLRRLVHIGVLDESRLKLDYVLDLFNLPSPSAFWSASGKSARYIDFSLIGGGHPGRAKERTCEKARVVAAAPEEDSACCPQCFDYIRPTVRCVADGEEGEEAKNPLLDATRTANGRRALGRYNLGQTETGHITCVCSSTSDDKFYMIDQTAKGDLDTLSPDHVEELNEEQLNATNVMKAVLGYVPQDDRRICPFYDPAIEGCFKGYGCRLENVAKLEVDWTSNRPVSPGGDIGEILVMTKLSTHWQLLVMDHAGVIPA